MTGLPRDGVRHPPDEDAAAPLAEWAEAGLEREEAAPWVSLRFPDGKATTPAWGLKMIARGVTPAAAAEAEARERPRPKRQGE